MEHQAPGLLAASIRGAPRRIARGTVDPRVACATTAVEGTGAHIFTALGVELRVGGLLTDLRDIKGLWHRGTSLSVAKFQAPVLHTTLVVGAPRFKANCFCIFGLVAGVARVARIAFGVVRATLGIEFFCGRRNTILRAVGELSCVACLAIFGSELPALPGVQLATSVMSAICATGVIGLRFPSSHALDAVRTACLDATLRLAATVAAAIAAKICLLPIVW
eukprot:CAMPEP_0115206872 /NCGR_PEP_ID=MMETSP0270-20121206/20427_1 /TAXON_ID=71861 /ORGANISM="Scrippsiella trochoidea, Strain CCMP3099" /LENGTH=220 /DNA_ID=CAMNT_0002620453 /DNA_START=958 /DNA_END=1617 /DNA_ORIENTATION=+